MLQNNVLPLKMRWGWRLNLSLFTNKMNDTVLLLTLILWPIQRLNTDTYSNRGRRPRFLYKDGHKRCPAELDGLQDSVAFDGLSQSGQWFNLREMKRISTALCTASSVSRGRSTHYSVKNPVQPPLYMSNHKSYLIISLRRYWKRGQGKKAWG